MRGVLFDVIFWFLDLDYFFAHEDRENLQLEDAIANGWSQKGKTGLYLQFT